MLSTLAAKLDELSLEVVEFFFRHLLLKIDQSMAYAFDAADHFIELEMNGLGIAVLCVLNGQHQEIG